MRVAVGTRVVYPVHGVASVVGREHRTIAGEPTDYVVLRIANGDGVHDLTLRVPVAQLEELGVRNAISADEAVEVLAVLAVEDSRVPSNWSRRFKNHQEKLRSGDVFACAEVVRNLERRQMVKPLAPAENAMLRRARRGLVSELAVSWGVDDDVASGRVDLALQRSNPAGRGE